MIQSQNILSAVLALIVTVAVGCAVETVSRPSPSPSPSRKSPEASAKPLDPSQAARLQRIMLPLVRAGNRTRSLKQVRVAVIEDSNINAANAGGGEILLEQILPGSSVITPIAGTLVARAHNRSEELAADQHAVELLERAGYSKDVMIDALAWVMRSSPDDGGGFLSTHPATTDRIEALRRLE